jgi:hypothetical protein
VVVSMRRLVCALVLVAVVPCVAAWTWPVRGPVLQTFSFDPAHPYAAGEHRGIAIGAATGAQVVAPAAGTVTFAGSVPTNGRSVTILTPSGLAVSLTHLGSIAVSPNASVGEGDPVGTVGPSGTPELDVPYVHLGIREASNDQGYLDPLGFLPVLAPPAPLPEPSPAPAPAPAPPPVAPVVAAPQATPPQPAAPPAPAPVSAPVPVQQTPAQPVSTSPAVSPVAETPAAPGVTVTAAHDRARSGIAVQPAATAAAPVHAAAPLRVAATPGVLPDASQPATVVPAPQAPQHPAGRARLAARRSPGLVPAVAPAAVKPPPPVAAMREGGSGRRFQLAVGLSALAAAVLVALLWIRWRLRPDEGRERTALV